MLGGAVLRAFSRVIDSRADRDGQAPALEPSSIPGSWTEPDGAPTGALRHRLPGQPQEILLQSLAQKVLDGWLQNRHQTLVPLAINLGRLAPGQLEVLMDVAAVALLSGSAPDEAQRNAVSRWLRSVGADARALEAFGSALRTPRPLSDLVREVREQGLEAYAYAAAVVASDQHQVAGRLFANYVAARLALPPDAVRSIDRRYRR